MPSTGTIGTTLFSNEGLLTQTVTTGTTLINVAFDNTGTVDVESGTLEFTAAVTNSGAGTLGVINDARLFWTAGARRRPRLSP